MASDKKTEKIKLIMGAVTMDTRTFQIVTPDDAAERSVKEFDIFLRVLK